MKACRYGWPSALHDEALARPLDFDQERYAQKVAAGGAVQRGSKG